LVVARPLVTGAVRRDTRVSTEHTAGVEPDGFHGGGSNSAGP
jgi:hypothetical protein